jgi:hypothetical protein
VPDHAEPVELTRVLGDPLAEKASSRKRAARDDLVRQLSAEGGRSRTYWRTDTDARLGGPKRLGWVFGKGLGGLRGWDGPRKEHRR